MIVCVGISSIRMERKNGVTITQNPTLAADRVGCGFPSVGPPFERVPL